MTPSVWHNLSKTARLSTSSFCHAKTKKQKKHTLKSSKKLVVILVCLALANGQAAHAKPSIFEPLLKILLPFYQGDKAKHENPPIDEPIPTKEVLETDEIPSVPDDGSDEDYTPAYTYTPNPSTNALIWELDWLAADDSQPVLDKPDLLQLLTAEFAADRNAPATALAIYKAESFKKDATPVFERALALSIRYESPKDSLAFASAWQKRNPEHTPAWFYVTHLAIKAGKYEQAAKTLAMILDYDPSADLTQIFTGIFPDEPDDQRALFIALRGVHSNNASVSVLRAGLLTRLGDHKAALLNINHALKLEPKNLAFINLKIDILKADHQTDAMWQFIKEKRKQLPHEQSLYLYEIRTLINQGDLAGAWQLLEQAIKNTHNPDVALLGGLVGLDLGKYKESIAILTPLTHNPELSSQAHYYLGIGYERLQDSSKARTHYEKVSDYDHVLDARKKVVAFYLLEERTDAAIATLVRLRDEYEAFAADSYILQAEIYLRQQNKQAAKDLLTAANQKYPDDDRLLFASYQLLEKELSDDEKQEVVNALLALDDQNPNYQLADAKLKLNKNASDQDTIDTITTISQLDIKNPYYSNALQLEALLLLAEHALSQGDYAMVIGYLQAPYNAAPNLQAGILLLQAYRELGDIDKTQQLINDLENRFAFGQKDEYTEQNY
ncbi:hypothetical protein LU293_06695 [Moraxella nasovis]|uniref:tetratricopeptide repeat protein n=1 Tax=Moraxella nasovis TaxID=2904121 RepID=UPI001F60DD61|nr:hypothetical protein [Moraxella nasovis]UNU72792.1 hypothetical protein LU293_06695 [Moraxella nasovis]